MQSGTFTFSCFFFPMYVLILYTGFVLPHIPHVCSLTMRSNQIASPSNRSAHCRDPLTWSDDPLQRSCLRAQKCTFILSERRMRIILVIVYDSERYSWIPIVGTLKTDFVSLAFFLLYEIQITGYVTQAKDLLNRNWRRHKLCKPFELKNRHKFTGSSVKICIIGLQTVHSYF